MTELTPLKVLIDARVKIADPAKWGKGMRGNGLRHFDTCCAAEAIEETAPRDHKARTDALRALYNASGLDWSKDAIIHWNDAPERTHAEVLAAFTLAIATLRLS